MVTELPEDETSIASYTLAKPNAVISILYFPGFTEKLKSPVEFVLDHTLVFNT